MNDSLNEYTIHETMFKWHSINLCYYSTLLSKFVTYSDLCCLQFCLFYILYLFLSIKYIKLSNGKCGDFIYNKNYKFKYQLCIYAIMIMLFIVLQVKTETNSSKIRFIQIKSNYHSACATQEKFKNCNKKKPQMNKYADHGCPRVL